ncbi:unnamed protein product [Boreogadus saida]
MRFTMRFDMPFCTTVHIGQDLRPTGSLLILGLTGCSMADAQVGLRADWTAWARCRGNPDGSLGFLCKNPGVVILPFP